MDHEQKWGDTKKRLMIPLIKYIVKWVIAGIAVLFVFYCFSCNVPKQQMRKDEAAVNRVKGNVNLLNLLGPQWDSLHPCVNDSSPQLPVLFLPGKLINVPRFYLPAVIYRNRNIDTTINDHRIVVDTAGNISFDFSKAQDTLYIPGRSVVDNRKLDLERNKTEAEKESKYRYSDSLSFVRGQITELRLRLRDQRKELIFSLIGNGIQLGVMILMIYLLFKKKTKIL
jgi:hypothetical protein